MTTSIVDQLGKKANTAIRTGDRFTSNAGKHYLQAGKFLVQAKAKVEHGNWLPYLKKHNIAERTAQTYMALAEGKTTVEEIRANDRERKAAVVKAAGKPADSKKKNGSQDKAKLVQSKTNKSQTDKPQENASDKRRRVFLKRIDDILRYAKATSTEIPFDEIDDKMISLVEDVAKAWTDLHNELVLQHVAKKNVKVDKEVISSLH